MKASEFRSKDEAELTKELEGLLRAQFSLRMQMATQQLSNSSQLRKVRRDIARVRTVQREKAGK
ncbi:50S ribosomal protein L29 [Pigmentiphaga litoralis]|jgi:large subunit ribosomal protein L29|uniref:Large ribosomal subunit protein uL29 n=1 Tax=Pigmentiphaga litoralis TaxID=516702 RepID=A0A7Y9IZN7_9BURK|nr:50S ribosomal protein L29 [Pigmentiphaga litoralis]NYE27049.1 large subunit ribosomal protein L29 [Pigmentiphaga litoralis]NYE86090.1 large subunit ribosomal protein L29 [Pigmentiphaga litoralis]GGX37055.1 50S ribosomal protein L29 [Pigmentiphaga litoralis]